MSSDRSQERGGEKVWKDFNQAHNEWGWRTLSIFPESHLLLKKAVESYDAGAIEGAVLLCRAALEGAFLTFLSIRWYDEDSFDIVFPTALDGKLRQVKFDELREGIKKKVVFSETQLESIDRIHEDGNFVAHFASRKIKQRMARSKKYRKWESSHRDATAREKLEAANNLLKSEKFLMTWKEAFQNLKDTADIMLVLDKVQPR
jgi:hypothetical protein